MTSGRGGRAPGVRHTGIVAGEPRDEEVVFHHPADGGPGGRVGRLRAGPDAVQRRGAAQGAVRDRGFGEGGAGADARRHRAVDQYLAPQGRDRQAADGAVEDAVQRAQGAWRHRALRDRGGAPRLCLHRPERARPLLQPGRLRDPRLSADRRLRRAELDRGATVVERQGRHAGLLVVGRMAAGAGGHGPTGARDGGGGGRRGEAVIVPNERGRYFSQGEYEVLGYPQTDGYDALSWIAEQPGSNGKVGTLGCSSSAEWQLALAGMDHPAHAAMVPMAAGAGIGKVGRFREQGNFYTGGVPRTLFAVWMYGVDNPLRAQLPRDLKGEMQIGRASCRERVCQYV